jgi:hypothetical protein
MLAIDHFNAAFQVGFELGTQAAMDLLTWFIVMNDVLSADIGGVVRSWPAISGLFPLTLVSLPTGEPMFWMGLLASPIGLAVLSLALTFTAAWLIARRQRAGAAEKIRA